MAKITEFEGKLPKRIDDYVIYKLEDDLIIRKKSGFTRKGLLKHPKYELSRQNATEFGLVATTCKAIRLLVAEGLTKHNNLAVVNNLTKKMRSLLVHDTENGRGKRNLKTAFAHSVAFQNFAGYSFTPDFPLTVSVNDCIIQVAIPDDLDVLVATHLGFQVQYLYFDFDTLTGQLEAASWQMQAVASEVLFTIDEAPRSGYFLLLYRFSFFTFNDEHWMPVLPEFKGLVVG